MGNDPEGKIRKKKLVRAGPLTPIKAEGRVLPTVPQAIESGIYIEGTLLSNQYKGWMSRLYTYPILQPLMQLMALSATVEHKGFSKTPGKKKKFKIVVADDHSVAKFNKTMGKAIGMYSLKNTVYIANNKSRFGFRDQLATLIHECSHYSMKRVFNNDLLPYSKQDSKKFAMVYEKTKDRLKKIVRADIPSSIERAAFDSINIALRNEDIDDQKLELIVKVPEILTILGYVKGKAWLAQYTPELLDFYENTVNPRIISYVHHGAIGDISQHITLQTPLINGLNDINKFEKVKLASEQKNHLLLEQLILTIQAKDPNENWIWLKDINLSPQQKDLILLTATEERLPNLAQCILTLGANPNVINKNGQTPLIIAATSADIETLNILIKQPSINLNDLDRNKQTALTIVLENQHWKLAQKLLEAGAKYCSEEALKQVIANGPTEVVTLLLKNGLSPNGQIEGHSLLFCAATTQNWPIAKLLLEQGANPDIAKEGKLLLNLATQNQQWELANLLIKKGGDSLVTEKKDHKVDDKKDGAAIAISSEQQKAEAAKALVKYKIQLVAVTHQSIEVKPIIEQSKTPDSKSKL